MGFEEEIFKARVEKAAEELEQRLDFMPDGLKSILVAVYGVASAIRRKDKQKGFFDTFLNKMEFSHEKITKMDNALVESNFNEMCRFCEDIIEKTEDSDKKERFKGHYEEFKADHEKKTTRAKEDEELNAKIMNSFGELWRSFGK